MKDRLALARGLAALAFLAAVPLAAEELPVSDVAETLSLANRAFLEGRLEESARHYRYLSTLGIRTPDPSPNIAIIHRDSAEADAALPAWTKVSLPESADGFVWNQRGWSYLALGDSREAATAFRRALDISTTTSMQAEANIGLALAAIRDDHPKASLKPLKEAWLQGPYILPMAAHLTGLAQLDVDDEHAALEYLGQSISGDPLDLESLKELARLNERVGENLKAWHFYRALLRFDPKDEDAASRAEKAERHILGDPKRLIAMRRLSRPFLDPAGKGLAAPSGSAERIRVALFTSEAGEPAHLTRTYFMTNAPFQIVARQGETVRESPSGGLQWEIIFRPETNLVEVRDTAHILQYTSKQPFRIAPQPRGGSVLIKSAELPGTDVADAGDRELRGSVEVVPTPFGFVLVNDLPLEDYLYGVVSAALPSGAPLEAYKAQAVVSRTRAMWAKGHPVAGPFPHDACDSSRCQRYIGLNSENALAVEAVARTEGSYLRHLNGMLAEVRQHAHCGGVTEGGADMLAHLKAVPDGTGPLPGLDSPESLERWVHAGPLPDRYCDQGGLTPPVQARWLRLLDARDISRRAQRLREIGKVRHLRALKRSPSGRILSLEVVGSADTLVLNGPDAISSVLSPKSLRSTLFTILPLYVGRTPTHFLLWGAGTGDGLGMCTAGAIGQASVGRKHHEILSHYFPGLVLWSPRAAQFKPAAAPRRKRNPRRAK
ncbi:MAG: hypothetical protein HY924_02600 [Elusimicrobia bacterium]|nr:hypothetical protein [Elusimicrobiota bacterium]